MLRLAHFLCLLAMAYAIPVDNGVEGEPEIECGPSSITVNFNTRAYRIQCFYMEADKTVSTQIEVSDLTTAFQTQVVPMPVCKYEILNGGPTGEPVQFATIGQPVYHKWTCDSETEDTFCAVVHSCTVDDGNGDTIQILDDNGCALDKFVLNNLEYPTDLMAGQVSSLLPWVNQIFTHTISF
ncbi:unnamed protein product [Cylicostephanus goldi]|uniref:ZP domain-containing protein n=1 Tax=Cylicostephanus goldi TaxID=71465 RepID=A0A3P7N7N7_CYLGO|nr:unnamed protein product [Cylicostephanus goldi]